MSGPTAAHAVWASLARAINTAAQRRSQGVRVGEWDGDLIGRCSFPPLGQGAFARKNS